MIENYNFSEGSYRSVIHLINFMNYKIGCEVGVYRGLSLLNLAQQCGSIEKMYAIDNWKPHTDYKYDENGQFYDIKDIELSKTIFEHNLKYSGVDSKIEVIEKDSEIASKDFKNSYFDFICLDCYSNSEEITDNIKYWWPKVKSEGLLIGHDSQTEMVRSAVLASYNDGILKSASGLSEFDNIWMVKK